MKGGELHAKYGAVDIKAKTKGAPIMASLSFAKDIGPLFRDKDIASMQSVANFNLSDYEDVRKRASQIYERLAEGSMPCDGAWPKENFAKFKQWIDDGMAA